MKKNYQFYTNLAHKQLSNIYSYCFSWFNDWLSTKADNHSLEQEHKTTHVEQEPIISSQKAEIEKNTKTKSKKGKKKKNKQPQKQDILIKPSLPSSNNHLTFSWDEDEHEERGQQKNNDQKLNSASKRKRTRAKKKPGDLDEVTSSSSFSFQSNLTETIEPIISDSPASTSSLSIEDITEQKQMIEEKEKPNQWEEIKGLQPYMLPLEMTPVFAPLIEITSKNVYIKGGAPRDAYYGFLPKDLDIVAIHSDPRTLMSLQDVLKHDLKAHKNRHNHNQHTIYDLGVDITLTANDNSPPDFLINSFSLRPYEGDTSIDEENIKTIYFACLAYNKKYFPNGKSAIEHLQRKELVPPGDAVKHFSNDIIRIIRGCRLSIQKGLIIPYHVKAAMSLLAEQFTTKNILEEDSLCGRILSEFNKLNPYEQHAMLGILNELGILSFLFAKESKLQRDTKTCTNFNAQQLALLLGQYSLHDLLELHLMGCALTKTLLPWVVNDTFFTKKPQNCLLLLKYCLQFPHSFKINFVQKKIKDFDPSSIKKYWGSINELLRTIILSGSNLESFKLLVASGIFGFLFPNADKLIQKSPKHMDYILRILDGAQFHQRPSIKYIYNHFLALEIVEKSEPSRHQVIKQIELLHEGRYFPILNQMSENAKGVLFGIVSSIKGFSQFGSENQTIRKEKISVTHGLGTFVKIAKTQSTPSINTYPSSLTH